MFNILLIKQNIIKMKIKITMIHEVLKLLACKDQKQGTSDQFYGCHSNQF